VPFFVVARQRPDLAGAAAGVGAGAVAVVGGVRAELTGTTAAGTGGRQFLQAPNRAAASASGSSIFDLAKELHLPRWYLAPVLVT
jgi:hypothetical protein